MASRSQIQEIPNALSMMLEQARTDYRAVVRKIRWGDGPVYVCGAGHCAALGLAAGYAFESLLGLPVVAHSVEVFQSYTLPLMRPRSVLVMISPAGDWPEAEQFVRTARQRGCAVVALANNPESALAKSADQVLLIRAEADAESPAETVCLHAAINFLAFEAARAVKRPEPHWEALDREFDQLPGKLEWVFAQLSAAVRPAGAELAGLPRLRIVGGGLCHFPAWRAARRMQSLAGLAAEAAEASEFAAGLAGIAWRDDAVLFLSGSHAKMKKVIHRCAAQAHINGARVLSLTDSNDRELVERSDLGILAPSMLEAPASTLTLFMLEWLAMEVHLATKPPRPVR